MAFEMIPSPLSAIESVRKLKPGEILHIQEGGLSSRRHWRPVYESGPRQLDFWAARTRAELVDSIQRQLPGANRAAVFLSGGLDSASVLAATKDAGIADIQALTIAYRGHPTGEIETAADQTVARDLDIPQRTIEVDVEKHVAPELLSTLFGCVDELHRETLRLINEHVLVSAATESGIDSILTEATPGNTSAISRGLLKLDPETRTSGLDETLERTLGLLGVLDAERIAKAVRGPIDTALWGVLATSNVELMAGLTPLQAAELDFRLRSSTHWSYLFAQNEPPFHGAEERTPFQDTRMALLNLSIPDEFTGLHSKSREKEVLRASFSREFGRKKEWAYPRAPSPSWLPSILLPTIEPLVDDGIIRPEYLAHLSEAQQDGTRKARTEVWRWFAFACWYQFQIKHIDPFAGVSGLPEAAT